MSSGNANAITAVLARPREDIVTKEGVYMPTLDELDAQVSIPAPDALGAFKVSFLDDFGVEGGDFVMDGSLPSWISTFNGRPVAIRGQTAPSGMREYVLNGSRLTLPGTFFDLPLEERQRVLVENLRRYA